LAEEAGFSAASWTALGRYVSSPGVFTEVVHLFMARDLTPGRAALEESEVLQVHWIPFEEALKRAANGEIEDGKSALGLWRASHWLNRDPRFV
jgi:ADP-ribose pyrophosphatase